MAKPPYIRKDEDGHAVYDLSGDAEAAAAGDEDAKQRQLTQRRLKTRRDMSRYCSYGQ